MQYEPDPEHTVIIDGQHYKAMQYPNNGYSFLVRKSDNEIIATLTEPEDISWYRDLRDIFQHIEELAQIVEDLRPPGHTDVDEFYKDD